MAHHGQVCLEVMISAAIVREHLCQVGARWWSALATQVHKYLQSVYFDQ
jgi:hypothetical protein